MELKTKVFAGVAWMVMARLAARSLGLVSTLVLVRFLAPADFGLIAIATATAAALELLTLFNFDVALVQAGELKRSHYDSAWTLGAALGLGLAVLLALGAHPMSAFYKEPRLVEVMYVLAFKYFLDSLGNPRTVDFRRELNFQPDFMLQFLPKLGGVAATIPLAIWLGDYRALLAGMLSSAVMGLVAGYMLRPYKPSICLAEAAGLIRFSKWLLLNNFVSFARTRSADFIVGRMLGTGPLGVYSVANEVANLPSSEMVAPISRVLLPAYVSIGQDTERLRNAFRSSLGMLACIVFPVCIGTAALAQPLVMLLLGPKWIDAIVPMSLLAIAGGIGVLQVTTGSVYNALAKPRMIAVTGAIHAATLIPLIIAGAAWRQIDGVAWAILGHSVCIGLFATYGLFVRNTPVTLADLWQACWRPSAACLVMYLVVRIGLPGPAASTLGACVALLAGSVIGGAAFITTLFVLWRLSGRPAGTEQLLIDLAAERWRRFRAEPEAIAPRQVNSGR